MARSSINNPTLVYRWQRGEFSGYTTTSYEAIRETEKTLAEIHDPHQLFLAVLCKWNDNTNGWLYSPISII